MRQLTIHVNGIDLCLRAAGAPTAPLVLFLHGFPEYSGAWDAVLPAFADRFHAVAPDLSAGDPPRAFLPALGPSAR